MNSSSLPVRFLLVFLFGLGATHAAPNFEPGDYLVKFAPGIRKNSISQLSEEADIDPIGDGWVRVQTKNSPNWSPASIAALANNPAVLYIQPNYKIEILKNFKISDESIRNQVVEAIQAGLIADETANAKDNPPIPRAPTPGRGLDPLISNQWGMIDIGVREVGILPGKQMIVAVIDTGVDYTHEDLVGQMWRNPGETGTDSQGRDKSSNGIDDDGNGYIDDIVGWDFVSNDNLPYDLTTSLFEAITGGGNLGHGTHCAGNVGASVHNGKGIVGAGQNVKIMAIRFLSEKGQGTTADAIKAIRYAVANRADVLSNSWGMSGEDPNDPAGNLALREAIAYAEAKGKLFIAAAGNGDSQGVGYDNDLSPAPAYPASYDHDIIVSVAAIDANNQLAKFSNFGYQSVDIGAPGVNVYSTVPGGKYQSTILNIPGVIEATWDGTSMATPHVAGAAALYWSQHPEKSWREVKAALLSSAVQVPGLRGRTVSEGKLNLRTLIGK